MSTILEVLENADFNLNQNKSMMGALFAGDQLHNAVGLLERGYGLYDDVEDLLNGGKVEDVPEKEGGE